MKRFIAISLLLCLCLAVPAEAKARKAKSSKKALAERTVSASQLKEIRDAYAGKQNTALQNALSHTGEIAPMAVNAGRQAVDNHFKYEIKALPSSPDQKNSGRCWLFTSLNYCRQRAIDLYNVEDFRFSPVYDSFWDALEKSNRFFENVIATRDQEIDSRQVEYYFKNPYKQGGEWHSFINITRKYGAVPECIMPETVHSNKPETYMKSLTQYLRKEGYVIREMAASGKSVDELREYKKEALKGVYRILALCLGEPPTVFTWNYTDKDGNRHTLTTTPQQFFKEIAPDSWLDDQVMIMNDPTHEYYKMYRVSGYANVIEGTEWTYLNLPPEDTKLAVLASIKDGRAVSSTSDWRKEMIVSENLMAMDNYDYESLFGMDFDMTKEARIKTRYSTPAHVMIIDAVDTDAAGKPVKFRLFNSSHSCGAGVSLTFTGEWFDEYIFRIVLDRKYLSEKALEALKQEPEAFPLHIYEYFH